MSEGSGQVNGLSSRSSRAERRRARQSSGSELEHSEDKENMESADDADQSRQPRKTAVAAASKMKMIDASEEDDTSEHKAWSRTSKRAAVIQSSSESEEHDQQGMCNSNIIEFLFLMDLPNRESFLMAMVWRLC